MKQLAYITLIALVAVSGAANAQDFSAPTDSTRYILDTVLFLFGGFCGLLFVFSFALRDAGLARLQNAPAVCLRMVGAVGLGAIVFWLFGYNLIYTVEPGGFLGEFNSWSPNDLDAAATGRSAGSHWLFQFGIALIPAAIVSSAVSERVRLWPYLIFAAAFTGLIHPIIASWEWGGGYLDQEWRFVDLGAAAIHIAGGAAALAAILIVGPRPGKYKVAAPYSTGSTALPISAFATTLILLALIGIAAAMTETAASVEAVIVISVIAVNILIAAAAGSFTALLLTQIVYKRTGLITSLAGCIGGVVALSADPLHPEIWQACMIGAVGGVIVTVASPFLDRFKIDDAGFVVASHFLCGVWGVIIVPWHNPDAGFLSQFVGAGAISAFAFAMSLFFWVAFKYSVGVRAKDAWIDDDADMA
ncbi:MAG: ammonium transporter [Marinicaulis sp.]|nr:ammonium transporter [Marinicaulis sp.]